MSTTDRAERARASRIRVTLTTLTATWMLLAAAVWAVPLQAQTAPQPAHSYAFGETASFTLEPVNGSDPAEATLYLDVNGSDIAEYAGTRRDDAIAYERDLASSPLPPFAEITYWWEIEGAGGDPLETQPITFRYVDNRYPWESLTRDPLTVHWVSGSAEVMNTALDVGTRALNELEYALDAPQTEPLHVYIYPSHSDLRSAMQLAGFNWAGGIAYPALDVALVAVPATDEAVVRMKRAIPHELTHHVLYDLLGPQGYLQLPVWLNEGLAASFEQSPNAAYALALEESRAEFIPLEALCAPFPDDAQTARLAYAQSQSVVIYLTETYGWSHVRDLLQVYRDGVGCERGVMNVLETDLEHLEQDWAQWLFDGETPAHNEVQPWTSAKQAVAASAPWLALSGFLLLPGALHLVAWLRER